MENVSISGWKLKALGLFRHEETASKWSCQPRESKKEKGEISAEHEVICMKLVLSTSTLVRITSSHLFLRRASGLVKMLSAAGSNLAPY